MLSSLTPSYVPCQTVSMQRKVTNSSFLLSLDALDLGCQFMGSGGGGSTRTFRDYLRCAVSSTSTVGVKTWKSCNRPVAMGIVGSLEAMDETPPSGLETEAAYSVLCKATSHSYDSVMPWQVGGVCPLTAIAASLQLHLPLLDADLVGRAVSSLAQAALLDTSQPVSAGLSTPTGEVLYIECRDCVHLESTVRKLLGRGCGWMVFAMSPRDVPFTEKDVIHGQLSQAHCIGQEFLTNRAIASRPDLLSRLNISIFGEGRITENTSYSIADSRALVAGEGAQAVRSFMFIDEISGSVIRCDATTEFLLVLVDGKLAARAPGIIVFQETHSGKFLAPGDVRHGMSVRILYRPHPLTDCLVEKSSIDLAAYGLIENE